MSAGQTIAIALIGSGALTALITWAVSRKQTEASTAAVLVETSRSLLDPLRHEITRLELVVAGQHQQVTELRAQVARLTAETAACHRDRDADRARLRALEMDLARYKAGPDATYETE